eukprot:TRINITY_DN25512_c0_g1_i1.p2 TRINITY_DN25512_c0_g1~~TRINITY_DN25512_c0_g1_i1.p2  ORF type:complete len:292 (+),score=58.37 TRINITY_DN25512_c0_g1_i1:77-877(+)
MSNPAAENWKNTGNQAFQKGNNAEAVRCYTKAIEIDPKSHVYYTNRATAYAGMEEWEKCLADSDKAIAIKDDWVKGYFRKGQALVGLKRYEEGVVVYRRAVELDPKNEDIVSRLKEAEQMHKKNKPKVNPDGTPFTPGQRAKEDGNEYFRTGKIPQAIETYNRALGLCTDKENNIKADIFCNRAACYVQLYEPHKVINDCTECLNIQPMNVKALLRRGLANESLDKMRLALDDFRKVMSIDPRNTVALQSSSRIVNALKAQGKSVE